MPTYVVPIDFSKGSRQALDLAIGSAKDAEARLVLVHAFAPGFKLAMVHDAGTLDPITQVQQEMKLDEAVEFATKWAKTARDAGLEVETVAEEEDAAALILRVAKDVDADMVILGRTGHGAIREFFLGSTADTVVRRAKVPVLVVPTR